MSHGDPMKWGMPGWRIEQKYAPGVLIGNWREENETFQNGINQHNSTHRQDYRTWHGHKPDVHIRRTALLNNSGLSKEHLFYHHGNRYSNNMISWYDEHYNKRQRGEHDALPALRNWDGQKLSWVPEKSDYPIQGDATNFGLKEQQERKWRDELANETRGDYVSSYQMSFTEKDRSAYNTTRYAVPRDRSSNLHPYNKINKDLHLRNVSVVKQPETLSAVSIL